jgi:hypothetical protein
LKQLVDYEGNNPEVFVMALDAARKIGDEDGIRWATVGILNQAWPEHQHVVRKATLAAAGLRLEMQKQGRKKDYEEFGRQLDDALYRDCIISVSWTGDADVDMFVQEPGGTICSRKTPRTTAGGVMMGDAYASGSGREGELTEYYVLPRGFSGTYRLLLRKVWGEVTAGKVTVAIYRDFRTGKQSSEQRQIELDEKGAIVQFELVNGRRTKSLQQQSIEQAVEQEFIVGRHILSEQFRMARSSEAASDYYRSRKNSPKQGFGETIVPDIDEQFLMMSRPTGYRPEISTIPEGASLTATATTADRLYVLINAAPFFSDIRDVRTFNFLGDADTAMGVGGGGGGGIGGAGGLGGGLF